MLSEAGLDLDRLVQLLSYRRRGKPDPLDPGAPARRAGADRPHPHQRRARSSADLRRSGRRDLGNRRRAGRHGGRLFQPQGGACDDGAADRRPAIAASSSSTGRAKTTNARAIAPKAISPRCREAGIARAADPRRARRRRDPAGNRRAGPARGQSRRCPNVDALFFTSDVFAVGAILACREMGIAVPDEIGIAGFHDLEIGRVVSPDAHHRARAGDGDGAQGRRDDPGAPLRQPASSGARRLGFHHPRRRESTRGEPLGVKPALRSGRHTASLTRIKSYR